MERIEFPKYAGDMPGVYDANSYAMSAGHPRVYGVTARIRLLDETYWWIDLFKRGEKVWECNPTFFATHFRLVEAK